MFLSAGVATNPGASSFFSPLFGFGGGWRGNIYVTETATNRILVFANPNPNAIPAILNLLLD